MINISDLFSILLFFFRLNCLANKHWIMQTIYLAIKNYKFWLELNTNHCVEFYKKCFAMFSPYEVNTKRNAR